MPDTIPVPLDTKMEADPKATPEKSFHNYEYAKDRIDRLMGSWDFEFKATDYRRRARNITVNVADLRVQGKIKPDETIIPIRLIDTNVKREEPPKLAYLKQSRRLGIFKPTNAAKGLNVQYLEEEFTRVCQYENWERDFIKVIDGAATHGWDAIEICYDPELPGNVCFDHIGHENLIFPLDAKDLEACDYVMRVHQVSVAQLRRFITAYGFNSDQVQLVIDSTQPIRQSNTISTQSVPVEDSLREIRKIFFKEDGVVFVAWQAKEANDYLLAPKPLFLGKRELVTVNKKMSMPMVTGRTLFGKPIMQNVEQMVPTQEWQDVKETLFPIKILTYEENEQPQIKDRKGRVYKDDYKQEALLALWSSFINGCIRASNVHAAPKNPATGSAPKQTNVIIEHGKLWSEPIDFFNTPWPDPLILNAAQALDIQNTQETLQLSAAVNNRQDSRKTAEEVKNVRQEQSLVNGVQVTLLSMFLRSVLKYTWPIVQSAALQNKIMFCVIALPDGSFQNDENLIAEKYEVYPAGDVDVVQRLEKQQKQLQFLPIIAQTSLGQEFLVDIIKNAFPDEANRYEVILRQGFQEAAQKANMQEQKAQQQEAAVQQGIMMQGQVNMQEKMSEVAKNKADAAATMIDALSPEEPSNSE